MMVRLTTEFIESLLESILTLPNVKGDQQETISLKKISKAKVTCYLREFWKYACDRHLSLEYVFQDFKESFEDWIVIDFNRIK